MTGDLPEPFSPSRACTSPGSTAKSTECESGLGRRVTTATCHLHLARQACCGELSRQRFGEHSIDGYDVVDRWVLTQRGDDDAVDRATAEVRNAHVQLGELARGTVAL